jgi:N-acetylglucosaminyl-diphospho-decaprenol L-rhamnosyltransferase
MDRGEEAAVASVDPPAPADVAIVVVTHDSGRLVAEFLTGLPPVNLVCRVVVVDSGSRDDTVARACEAAPHADVLTLGSNLGYGAGINAGIAHVRATGGAAAYIVANPDTVPDRNAVERLVAALRQPGAGLAAPLLRGQDGTRQDSLRNSPTVMTTWSEALFGGPLAARLGLPVEVVTDPDAYAAGRGAAWATGGFLAVSEECSRALAPWPEHYFLYEEEVDFCLAAARAGWALRFVPDAEVVRRVDDTDTAPWRQALMRRNRVRRVAEASRVAAAATAAGLVVGDALRALAGRPEARAGVWAVLHRATPVEVMQRYEPRHPAGVGPGAVAVIQSSWGESA